MLTWMQSEGMQFAGRHVSYETVYVEFAARASGPRGYHPDFVLYLSDPIVIEGRRYTKAHIEVSGFRDRKKVEKMRRLKEDYGARGGIINVEIVEDIYRMLEGCYADIVPFWERSTKAPAPQHEEQ